MEENNKYYIPDIEDLHVGYICEVQQLRDGDPENREFIPTKLNELSEMDLFDLSEYFSRCRTKYLDKEDIESLGWSYRGKISNANIKDYESIIEYNMSTINHEYKLYYTSINIIISRWGHNSTTSSIYQGECKSINELKKIMQWIKIN